MDNNACMKCGRERPENQVFCEKCLADMKEHPVKPGVVVLLPRREEASVKAAPKRRQPALPPEEQVKILKKQVVSLILAVLILLGATVGLGWLAVKDWMEDRDDTPKPGQNYSSEVSYFPSEK